MTVEQMSDAPRVIDALIEHRKLKYLGNCKCGQCQLVPLDLLNDAIDALTAARIEGERRGLERAAKVAEAEDGPLKTWRDGSVRINQYRANIAAAIRALAKELPHA